MAKMAFRTDFDPAANPQLPSWPHLLAKTVDDLTSIIRTDIQLLGKTLEGVVEAQTDKISAVLVLMTACVYASLLLLGAVVLLLHLWLDLSLSMLITSALVAGSALVLEVVLKTKEKKHRSYGLSIPWSKSM